MQAEEKLKEQNVKLQELAHSERTGARSAQVRPEPDGADGKAREPGTAVAGVAHEINNPLAFVSNNVAVLERDLRDLIALVGRTGEFARPAAPRTRGLERPDRPGERQLDLDYTLDNLPQAHRANPRGPARIERIVKDLRLFARVDEGEWNEVDLNPGIESSVNMVQGYARKDAPSRDGLSSLPLIRCRAARVHQVIVNLLMNAIDACPAEGKVTIRTGSPGFEGIRIGVADTGCGIDPLIRERIFDPFFTTKPIGEGTGLGLSISYGIVEEHGYDRRPVHPGQGATLFTVRWATIEPEVDTRPRGRSEMTSFQHHKILRTHVMKLGLINSAWVQAGRGTAFGIRKTKEIGFDSIDIFADPLDMDVNEKR